MSANPTAACRFPAAGLACAAALGLLSCSPAAPVETPQADPDAAVTIAGAGTVDREELRALARAIHDGFTAGVEERIVALTATREELIASLQAEALAATMAWRRADWLRIGEIARSFVPFRQSLFDGWCVRGLRVSGPADGFSGPVRSIDSLFVVGRIGGTRFGAWVERIARLPAGWRILNLSVETPRENHSSIDLWDCDFGEIGLSLPER